MLERIAMIAAKPWQTAVAVGLLTALVFLPAIEGNFVNWDDDAYVYENPLVQGGLSVAGIAGGFDAIVCHNWAPVTIWSYQLDRSLFGPGPAGFHLTNVVIHACDSALLYVAVRRMTAAPFESFVATILFAVHPLRVESVAWISERKDVLSVLFLSLLLLAYEAHARQPGWRRMALVLAAFCAGLMAKATLVTVPVLLLLVDVWPLDRWAADGAERDSTARAHRRYPQQPTSALLLEKLPLFLVATLMAAGTLLAQRRAITDEAALPLLSVRIPNAVHAVGWYLWKTAFPTQLAALYRHPGGQGWPLFDLVSSGAAIALVVVVAWSIRRAVPAAAIGVGWFLIAVSPVIGIVAQVGQQAHADRYSYVPHIGLFWALTWTGSKLIRQRWLPPAAVAAGCVALIGVYATLDRLQIAVGRDSQPLWQRVLTLDPENTTACNNLGVALYEAGRPSEAEAWLERAVNVARPDPRYVRNLERVRATNAARPPSP